MRCENFAEPLIVLLMCEIFTPWHTQLKTESSTFPNILFSVIKRDEKIWETLSNKSICIKLTSYDWEQLQIDLIFDLTVTTTFLIPTFA